MEERYDMKEKYGGLRYLRSLNLLPLGMFFLMYFQSETILHRAPLVLVVVLGIINALISKNMKEYLLSSLMLFLSCILGMIIFAYYYYYRIQMADEVPIIAAFVVMVYAIVVLNAFAVGSVVVVIRDRVQRVKRQEETGKDAK
ncbi:hypothetical protein [Butyrivibrio sp. AC2005]|uniref:hypothetical protein n=1 Tax=Butyrivibrio sp. AC2005 TaxID=1280672 RepID=UPI0003F98E7B|nr:hypothetical protein [Butyrivibrio sp. AC2005]